MEVCFTLPQPEMLILIFVRQIQTNKLSRTNNLQHVLSKREIQGGKFENLKAEIWLQAQILIFDFCH